MGHRMTRREDWPSRLDRTIQAARERPFSWGSHDCCTFAADCVEAVTGERPWPAGFGGYATAAQAQRRMLDFGWSTVADVLDAMVGERVPVPLAQRGDLVLAPAEGFAGAAVVDLTGQHAVGVSHGGLLRVPVLDALAAWRVG
jgi:hypothetical protein